MRAERHATIAEEDEELPPRELHPELTALTPPRAAPLAGSLAALGAARRTRISLMDDIGGADLIVDGTVFVSDDDERAFENEDDDAAEVVVNDGGGDWQVQLQTLMCWVLLCTLLVLVLLIFLSWRKYGRIIMRSRAGASADAKKKER